ncbi:MAG: ATP-binding protein [Puniceicoccales bacterium]|nr:ATP-binding protein [Puniceicoccales bacterium]
MIARNVLPQVLKALDRQAAVALMGPRQVGKTTLALEIAKQRDSIYLDLESREDRAKLQSPSLFISSNENKLIILDEIHRMPELFQDLRGFIDVGRRKNLRNGRFLILGSASTDLLKQSGETLAGRIEYVDISPLNIVEIDGTQDLLVKKLFLRGGFPDSYLANSDDTSYGYRQNFIRTYLERDIQQWRPRIPAETLSRLWTMIAHSQGQLLNNARLAESLALSSPAVNTYIDLLVDLLLVRRLKPFYANTKKRLIKMPKIYIRDSGLTHALLGIVNYNQLLGHPIVGASFEGFVIETLLSATPQRLTPSFYRTSAGAEIDLLLEFPQGDVWAIEIKSGTIPQKSKGFHMAIADVQPTKAFIVHGGRGQFPMDENLNAIGLPEMVQELNHRLVLNN